MQVLKASENSINDLKLTIKNGEWFTTEDLMKMLSFIAKMPMNGQRMNDLVLLAGGSELGLTAHSEYNIEVGQDVGNSSWTFEWRGWVGVHVSNWKRVMIIRNVFYDGIISGGNVRLIDQQTADEYKENNWDLGMDQTRPSLYSLCMPKNTFADDDIMLNLTGESPWRTTEWQKAEYPGAKFYSWAYGWDNVPTTQVGIDAQPSIAQTGFKGSVSYFTTGGNMITLQGHGHHGPHEEHGCNMVRRYGTSVNPTPIY